MPRYSRILLKVSGEAFGGDEGRGIHLPSVHLLAEEMVRVHAGGTDLAVVVGGGNLFRGRSREPWLDQATADSVGMLGTSMNGVALTAALEELGVQARHMTAVEMRFVGEPFLRRRALRHMEKRRILVLSGGTGNPFFTTDSAAALRGAELCVDAVFKATKVRGVFSGDPHRDDDARFLPRITYQEVLEQRLEVMDAAAIALCRENRLPIHVFNLYDRGTLERILQGEDLGSVVEEGTK